MKINEELKHYVKAGCRLIGIESRDDLAAESAIASLGQELGMPIVRYDHDPKGEGGPFGQDRAERLRAFIAQKDDSDSGENRIVALWDVGQTLMNPEVVAAIKKRLLHDSDGSVFFVVGRIVEFCPELETYAVSVTVEMPDLEEISGAVREFADGKHLTLKPTELEAAVHALKGIERSAIPRMLGIVYERTGAVEAKNLMNEKAMSLKKGGHLELVDVSSEENVAGGMDELYGYLTHVSHIFGNQEMAREMGVDIPKGINIIGMPGCGKSLAAKAAARMFGIPLLRLDTGKLMGKYNGESERNLREALATAEALAPAVLWIDELEKAFAGVGKDSDNGVATRLFGSFLTWLNERREPVYTIATANDIDGLPPELLRRGRFDQLFFVDFPSECECAEILRMQIGRRGHSLSEEDVNYIAGEMYRRGFSGADVEGVVKTAIEFAFERHLEKKPGKNGSRRSTTVEVDDFREAMAQAKSTRESLGKKVDELRAKLEEYNLTPASTR